MKKLMRKLLAVVAAMTMVMGLAVTANAQTVHYDGIDPAQGKGSISISNPTKGQEYAVYKLFDATQSADGAIAYTGNIPASLTAYFQKDSAGNITGTDGHKVDFAKDSEEAKALKAWTQEQGVKALKSATSDGTKPLTFDQLPYGYYVVTTTLAPAAVSVTSTNNMQTIIDKNTSNGGEDTQKKITGTKDSFVSTDPTNLDGTDTTASAKIGDTVYYKVTFTAQNYNENNDLQTNYTLTDTSTGLDIDEKSVNITIQKKDATTTGSDQYEASTHKATINKDGGKMTVSIPWGEAGQAGSGDKAATQDTSYYDAPAIVTITYKAVLTSTTGTNTAKVNDKTDGSKTEVDTASLKIKKVDSKKENALKGAEFDLYDVPVEVNNDGTVVAQTKDVTAHKIPVVKDGNDYVVTSDNNTTTVKIAVDDNGLATIKGLKQSTTYYLLETKAPDGYTLPTKSVEITTGSTKDIPANATPITNTKGTPLPSTGGMGTTIFYVLGAALVIGAGVVLVTRRRLSK